MRFAEDFVLALEAWRAYPTPHRERTAPWVSCADGIARSYVLARVDMPRRRGGSGPTTPMTVRTRPPVFR